MNFSTHADIRASPDELQRLLAAIRREPPSGDSIRATICPFKGLEACVEEDAALFFGGQSETGTLCETVRAHRVAAVIAASRSCQGRANSSSA